MKPETLRALTLLLCAIGGLAAIYLGYDLYRLGVEGLTEATGEWNHRRFWLVSGGPGLLFVAAGTVIVVSVIWRRFTKDIVHTEAPPATQGDHPARSDGPGGGGGGHYRQKILMDKRKDPF